MYTLFKSQLLLFSQPCCLFHLFPHVCWFWFLCFNFLLHGDTNTFIHPMLLYMPWLPFTSCIMLYGHMPINIGIPPFLLPYPSWPWYLPLSCIIPCYYPTNHLALTSPPKPLSWSYYNTVIPYTLLFKFHVILLLFCLVDYPDIFFCDNIICHGYYSPIHMYKSLLISIVDMYLWWIYPS